MFVDYGTQFCFLLSSQLSLNEVKVLPPFQMSPRFALIPNVGSAIYYIGCLTRVIDVQRFRSAGENQTVLQKLDIENLSGDVVEQTLWDEMAINLQKAEFDSMHKLVIIAIPELDQLLAEFTTKYNLNPPLEISKTRCTDPDKEKATNRYPLSTLLQENLDTYKIMVHNQIPHTELVKKYEMPDTRDFPKEILDIEGRHHIFQFHYNPYCETGRVDFYFDDILDKPLQITGTPKVTLQLTVSSVPLPSNPTVTPPSPSAFEHTASTGHLDETEKPTTESAKTPKRILFPTELQEQKNNKTE
ncbi:hypothetical protein Tco_0496969 [Tanacetum coccineum]